MWLTNKSNKRKGWWDCTSDKQRKSIIRSTAVCSQQNVYYLSLTLNLQGKGEFSMEFKNYSQAHPQTQAELAESYSGGAVGGGGAAASGKKAQKDASRTQVVCYVMKWPQFKVHQYWAFFFY